jgi:hypothetical protein
MRIFASDTCQIYICYWLNDIFPAIILPRVVVETDDSFKLF